MVDFYLLTFSCGRCRINSSGNWSPVTGQVLHGQWSGKLFPVLSCEYALMVLWNEPLSSGRRGIQFPWPVQSLAFLIRLSRKVLIVVVAFRVWILVNLGLEWDPANSFHMGVDEPASSRAAVKLASFVSKSRLSAFKPKGKRSIVKARSVSVFV